MNITEAVEEVEYLLGALDPPSLDWDELGTALYNAEAELRYLLEYAKAVRTTPTTHDSKAEGESWDLFFAERKALVDGNS